MKPYEFDEQVRLARIRITGFDKADGAMDRSPFTILTAFEGGLRREDDGAKACLFDAFVMLQDVVSSMKEWRNP